MIGSRIGQYQVLQLLGEGGMGRVVLVEHVVMKTRHAIKVLHDQLSKNEMIVQRFLNEARAAGAIGHRNVVEITHVDQIEGGGAWYLVMKYLEGHTLTSFLASRSAPLAQHLIVHIAGEALNGLQAAHERRIIHRDLKPDNLYITSVKDDPVRTIILDFGVAQLGHEAGIITRTGAMIGTPQYMAPEQHRTIPIDHRADIWAMGAIVYEMATGRLPYQLDGAERGFLSGPEIFHRMMTRTVVDPRQHNPAITEAFARATLTALAMDPARRPQSARALALMLADATPGTSQAPSGFDVLRTHADELLEGQATRPATMAAALPESGRQPRVAAQHVAQPTPMSTLGATASQSLAVPRPPGLRRRRAGVAAGIAVVAVAVTTIVLVSRRDAPGSGTPRDQGSAVRPNATVARVPAHDSADVVATTRPDAARPDAVQEAARATVAGDVRPLDAARAVSPREAGLPDAAMQAAEAGPATAGKGGAATPVVQPRNASVPDGPSAIPAAAGKREAATPVAEPRNARVPDGPTAAQAARGEPAASGKLKVVILPWAEVWVDGKPLGQTPVLTRLAVGTHRVRLKNDVTEKTVTVTVTANRTSLIDETW